MSTKLRAVFDGQVFRPEERVELEPDAEYILTVERAASGARAAAVPAAEYPLTALGRLATDMGVADLAARHDWYARGRVDGGDSADGGRAHA